MADDPTTSPPFSLKRWSQRKLAAARKAESDALPSPAAAPAASPAIPDAARAVVPEAVPLPPVESLTFDSDFAAFMQPKVDDATKRAALKKLFSDPSFNVMDGLDIYVGDYTQPDPMPAGMLDRLSAVYAMLDPVKPPPEPAKPVADATPPASTVPASETTSEADAKLADQAASATEVPAVVAITHADAHAAPMPADPPESGAGDADAAKPA